MASMYDPTDTAHNNPYYKRNHLGKVTCTLCNVYCNDEANFLRHLAGKTHTLQLERLQHSELRRRRLEEEERANAAAYEQAERERAMHALTSSSSSASSSLTTSGGYASNAAITSSSAAAAAAATTLQTGRFGTPPYTFRTEHDSAHGVTTKVWLDLYFAKAEEGTRPLHRWMSAREQHVEAADDYYVYLVVACEGYTTVAMKFPTSVVDLHSVVRTTVLQEEQQQQQQQHAHGKEGAEGGEDDYAYRCTWDMVRKVYALYFVLRRTVA